jgi:hypothetical protein
MATPHPTEEERAAGITPDDYSYFCKAVLPMWVGTKPGTFLCITEPGSNPPRPLVVRQSDQLLTMMHLPDAADVPLDVEELWAHQKANILRSRSTPQGLQERARALYLRKRKHEIIQTVKQEE